MEPNEPHYVEVYRARNIAQAHVLKGLLEGEGIPALVENDLLQGAVGDIPVGWATSPRVLVEAQNALRARAIAEQFDASQAASRDQDVEDEARCLACGELLWEEEDRCRACGWSYGDGGG